MSILGKVIKSAIIEKASIDEVYLDVTEEATRRLNAIQDDVVAFNAIIALARASSLAGEDAVEMKMSKNTLRKGHSGTKKDDDAEFEGPNVRDWFEQPHYMWNHDDKLLLCGAIICDELRSEVLKQINYSCSGGVAHNKMLSKIASAMHKPNRQTLVPSCAVQNLMHCLPINRVAGFGGKLGDSLSDFGGRKLEKFSDLIEVGKSELSAAFGEETAIWMLNAASGIDHTPVEQRALTASIGCGKSYRQKNTLPPIALQDGRVLHWLRELSEELEERVQMDTDMHSRKPKQITVGLSIAYVIPPKPPGDTADPVKKWHEGQGMSLSKVGPMCAGAVAISKAAHAMAVRAVADSTRLNKPWNITYISLSASGFVPIANESRSISSFFKTAPSPIKKSKSNPSSPYDTNTAMLLNEIKEKEEKNEKEEKEIQQEINNKNLLNFNITAIPTSNDSVTAGLLKEFYSDLLDRNSDTIEHGLETVQTVKTVNSITEMKSDFVSEISTHGAKNVPQDFCDKNDDDCDEYMHDEISDSIKEIRSYYTDKCIIRKKNMKNDYIDCNGDNIDSKNGCNNDKSSNNNNFNENYDVFGNIIDKSKIRDSRNNTINDDTNQSNFNYCKTIKNFDDNLVHNISDIIKRRDKKDSSECIDTNNKKDNDSLHAKNPSNILRHEQLTSSFHTSIVQPFDTMNHNNNSNSIDNDLFLGRIISVDGKISRNLHDNQQENTVCGMESVENDMDDSDDVIIVENDDENSSDYNDMYDYNDYNNDSNDSNSHNINTYNNTTNFVKNSSQGVSSIYHDDNNDCNNDDTIISKSKDINDNSNHDNINHKDNYNDNDNSNNNSDSNNNNLINNSNEHSPFNNSTSLSNIDIDMDVFYSLPLDLQKELSIAMNIPNVLNVKESKNINRVSIGKIQKNKVNLNNSKNKINTAILPMNSSQLSSFFCNSGKCTKQDKDKNDIIMIEDDENDNEDDDHNIDTNIDSLLPSTIR